MSQTDSNNTSGYNERLILLVLATVQFITIVDFMIVMPLGPQLMRVLHINPAAFGLIVSSYTFAAGVAGLVASATVDRFSRKSAFLVLYAGFILGTLLCGLAPNYGTLVFARILTGAFGGILGGISMAIIGDVFPDSRRGRATGAMMTGFAIASVAGVPLGLVIGNHFGWNMTFIALALSGVPVLFIAAYALPSLDAHFGETQVHPLESLRRTFTVPNHLNAFALIIALTCSGFLIFPYISAYFVGNVGMSEQQLPWVYIAGGALTFFTAPVIGRWADRAGKLFVFRVIAPLSAALMFAITHLYEGGIVLAIVVFGALMVCNVGRMIPAMAMITASVAPRHRGAFLSANSSIQHIFGGVGAYLGGLIVSQAGEGAALEGFGTVGWIAAGVGMSSLWLAGRLRSGEQEDAVAAEDLSLPAAAEAAYDPGEPIVAFVDGAADVSEVRLKSINHDPLGERENRCPQVGRDAID
ncbi:Major facilitator superfamily MFS-1 [Rhodopirellula maiorica SM1]|uniref:Major facilitator superfamily MFS-1 n=1 Tax=Rhodopirellula maiorica SM1 TaxID=1265738 RepID=M5RRY0_9BACT|nr:MFS transporter [Rhodopirellula maiorica]EMI21961.1 Major facilitator superfamily MFS-1 [Rhodopirellula maiorica SM1]